MSAQANQVHEHYANLRAQFTGATPPPSPAQASDHSTVAALRTLMQALGWRGEERHLMEALPHFDEVRNIQDFRAVLARLNFETLPSSASVAKFSESDFPCLFAAGGGGIQILLRREGATLHLFDAATKTMRTAQAKQVKGEVYKIVPVDLEKQSAMIAKHGWIGMLVRKFRPLIVQLLLMTFVINLFALAVPIFVMNVYDKAIGARSEMALLYFVLGIAIVLAADMCLRFIRAKALAYLGARFDAVLGPVAFQKILHLPIAMTESVPIGSQLTKLRQFESVRELFTGTLASAVLDMPFMLVFLAAIIIFGGTVAWVPVTLIALYAVLAAVTVPITRRQVQTSGEHRARAQNFLIELATKTASIREARAERTWLERYRKIAADAALGHFRAQQTSQIIQTIAQSMVTIAGVATLGVGTLRVLNDDMTLGALIAVMAMVWRVLAPVQAAFLSLNRLSQVTMSFRQVNHLMQLKTEREPGLLPSFYREFKGALKLTRVSFRYTPRSEPSLMGLTLALPPGQLVAVSGPNGAGKTTLLKVIAGLYQVQAGSVQLDGLDLRQIDVGELRHAIAYVPQEAKFFYGTIEQNLRFAHPEATDAQIAQAIADARVMDFAELMPEGLQTRLTPKLQKRMPNGFKQRLMLARAYVKDAPIYLFDEPANGLDRQGDEALCAKLEALRGRATVIIVTHRPSHMRLCDRVVYLDAGQLVHDGKPDQVLPLITQPG